MLNEENREVLKRTLSFWDRLTDSEQALLMENTESVSYRQGETVYSAVRECIGVLLVKSGELRAYILSEDGREITLYRLHGGDVCILSASCLLKSITFDVYIDAQQDSEILLINAALFSKLMSNNVYVENFSLKIAVDRFSDVMWTMEQILFLSFDKRMAIFLLDEISRTGSDTVALTQEQIAKYIGSAREVVSRCLKYFSGEGIVEVRRGGIKILHKEKLKKLV